MASKCDLGHRYYFRNGDCLPFRSRLANTSVRRINFLDYLLKVHRLDLVADLVSAVWFLYVTGETKRGWGGSEHFDFKKAEENLTGIPTTFQSKYNSSEEFTVCSKPKTSTSTSTSKSTFYYVNVMSYRLYRRTKEGGRYYHRKILAKADLYRPRNDPQIDFEIIPTPKWSPFLFTSSPKMIPN